MNSRSLLCLLAVSLCASPVFADTVWMKNGDRLSGKIKVFDGGKLLLETPYGGSIALDWKQVQTLESDQEMLVKQDAYSGEKAKSLKAAEPGKVTLANGEAPKTVELASIEQIRTDVREGFTQSISGTDLIVGPRTGATQLLLYSIFRIGQATHTMRWDSVEALQAHRAVRWVVPMSLGDSHRGFPVVATTLPYFEHFHYGDDQALALARRNGGSGPELAAA